jgi:hypothetical protein
MPRQLSRRTLLKGAGGVAIGLPALEIMLNDVGTAHADGASLPHRYLVAFGGFSLGGSEAAHPWIIPDGFGHGYDLKTALLPLADFGNVKDEISIVSGLAIPTAAPAQGAPEIPPGGKPPNHHGYMMPPLFTGVRATPSLLDSVSAPSSDQIVADAIGAGTSFRSLAYLVEAASYVIGYGGHSAFGDIISHRRTAGGSIEGIVPQQSPKLAYTDLFGALPPGDPEAQLTFERARRKRLSILDLLLDGRARLVSRVGAADRRRLEKHFDEIRAIESRLAELTTAACTKLDDPGDDPPLGDAYAPDLADVPLGAGYSDEDLRARIFCDILHMAFVCDLARVATLVITTQQSAMNVGPAVPLPIPASMHGLSHDGSPPELIAKGIGWHLKHFGYLVSKLRDTEDGDGRLIDRFAGVFLHEGGWGYSAEGNQDSSHSTYEMMALVAGRAGGLEPGKHVRAAGKHPANVLITAMQAVGVDSGGMLGEVAGDLPELRA